MRRPSPALVVAIVALVVAAAGTGYAAINLPRNSVGAQQLKPNAVSSGKVENRSLRARDFARDQLPAGPKGEQGPPGPFVDVLPSGRTLRGAYAVGTHPTGPGQALTGVISFPFPLEAAPQPHVVGLGGQAPTECPGNANNPQAAPGHLCVYEAQKSNTQGPPQTCSFEGCPSITRWGGGIQIFADADPGPFNSAGSWAVTAP